MIDTELVKQTLNLIRPALQADGGDIDLVKIDDNGDVYVRLTGACKGCMLADMDLQHGVARVLRDRGPGVRDVINADTHEVDHVEEGTLG